MIFIQFIQVSLCHVVCITSRYVLTYTYQKTFFLSLKPKKKTKKNNTTESYDKSTKRNYPNKSLSINQNQCRARHYKFRFLLSPEISNVVDA